MSRQHMKNVRAQMGHVAEARPFGIHRLARTISNQMAESYGNEWYKDDQMVEMSYLVLALQLRRCGVASETRFSIDGQPRLFLGAWILKMGDSINMHPCPAASARRRFGGVMFQNVDVSLVYAWAKKHDLDPSSAPVLSDHIRNKDRMHADVIARRAAPVKRVM